MTYVEGFLAAVPTANKDAYRRHAESAAPHFKRLGATRLVENWGDDVPDGKVTSFGKSVQAKDDETVVFSWIEYPSKEVRDSVNAAMMEDPGFQSMDDMPFDGKRMIWSGFQPFVDAGGGSGGYIDGYLMVVPAGNEEAYKAMAQQASQVFLDHGAVRVVEAWSDDLMDGTLTDYKKAAQLKDGESLVFSWVSWPDKAARDAGGKAFMEDERIKGQTEMPFDGPRAMFGGFETIVDQ